MRANIYSAVSVCFVALCLGNQGAFAAAVTYPGWDNPWTPGLQVGRVYLSDTPSGGTAGSGGGISNPGGANNSSSSGGDHPDGNNIHPGPTGSHGNAGPS